MHKKDIFRLGLLASALALSQGVWALGLGKLTVNSPLGHPLNAQIELMGTRDEFSELTANIAAPSMYQQKDLIYQGALARTKIVLERRADGSAFLKIMSSQPVTEPYIDLLIEVNWPAGHALREYTVLLDPPSAGRAEPMMPAQQATVRGRVAAVESRAKAAAPVAGDRARPTPTPLRGASRSAAGDMASGDGYTVQRGDTLSGIAQIYKTDEITLNQALAALYEANPSAFIGKNMNRLRAGAVIAVPTQEAFAATDSREAGKVVRVHVAEWRNYIAEVSGQPAPVSPGASKTTAEGAITPTPTKVEGARSGGDQLVVSAGSADSAKARGNAAGNAASEEKVALEKALQEEKSRVRDLDEIVKKMQRQIDLQNQALADLQKKAEEANRAKVAGTTAPVAPTQTTSSAPTPVAPAKAPTPEPAPAPEPIAAPTPTPSDAGASATPPGAAMAGGETKIADPAPAPPPRPTQRVKPAPPPPPEPTLLETIAGVISENWMILVGVLGLAALGGGYTMYRRRRAEEEVIDSMFGATTTSGGTVRPSSTSFGSTASANGVINTMSGAATAGSNSILSEFSREGLGSIDTGEVDPLAEADVYLAYGRAQQAEEILQDALKRGPDRQDFFLKLLEVYADQKKTDEFEMTANQLFALTNGQGEYWQKAATLGQRLLPGNPQFVAAAGASLGAISAGDFTYTHTATATEPMQVAGQAVDPRGFAPMEAKSIAESAAEAANRAMETRTEPGTATRPPTPPVKDFTFGGKDDNALEQEDFGVDLDLEELSRFRNYGKAEEQVDMAKKRVPDVEFNLDEFTSPPKSGGGRRPPTLADLGFSENGSLAENPSPSMLEGQWHDTATKLDLARAYQATGDAEACREILQEVLQEGDDQQKTEARAILQSLT